MPPSFLQRNSNHRSLENIWCIATARAPGHILPLPRWRYGAMANANFFLVRHGFSFLRQSQHSQHWQLPGHPDRIKSLMDSAEVPLVSMHLSNDQRAGWGVVQPSGKPGLLGGLPWVQDCLGGWKCADSSLCVGCLQFWDILRQCNSLILEINPIEPNRNEWCAGKGISYKKTCAKLVTFFWAAVLNFSLVNVFQEPAGC